jgi:2-polyprenyl-6-methoxyphenol hydroxylase-like FAD-dependent oxidoreductase
MTEGRRHRVLIVGGGFGGLFAAKFLRRAPVDVTLVDRTNHRLFQPLLYQLATGILSEGAVAPPLRQVLRNHKNVTILLAKSLRSTSRTGASLPHVQSGRPSSSNTTRSSSQPALPARTSATTSTRRSPRA